MTLGERLFSLRYSPDGNYSNKFDQRERFRAYCCVVGVAGLGRWFLIALAERLIRTRPSVSLRDPIWVWRKPKRPARWSADAVRKVSDTLLDSKDVQQL